MHVILEWGLCTEHCNPGIAHSVTFESEVLVCKLRIIYIISTNTGML